MRDQLGSADACRQRGWCCGRLSASSTGSRWGASRAARREARRLGVGRRGRHLGVLIAVPALALAVTSCTPAETTSTERLRDATALGVRLDETLRSEGRSPYGGLSGLGGATREGIVQLASDRGRTSIYATCHGPAGEARVSIDDGPSRALPCSEEPQVVVLQDESPGAGLRVKVSVVDAPAGAVWAVTAGASPSP